jgi:mycothiol synthase
LEAVVALVQDCERTDLGEVLASVSDMKPRWDTPEGPLTTNAWVAVAPDGALVGFARVWLTMWRRFFITVHPDHRRRGIGSHLLNLVEARACEHPSLPDATSAELSRSLRVWIAERRRESSQFAERRGYVRERTFYDMQIDLRDAPPTPVWPDQIHLEAFDARRDLRELYDAVADAFADHWGGMGMTYDQLARMTEQEGFDPSLWYLARDGEAIAGGALCTVRNGKPWIDDLFVRRPWRRRGLALALLHHAFSQYYARGFREVGLSVDSENPTGATRVYERAGMSIVRSVVAYEKTLSVAARPGEKST